MSAATSAFARHCSYKSYRIFIKWHCKSVPKLSEAFQSASALVITKFRLLRSNAKWYLYILLLYCVYREFLYFPRMWEFFTNNWSPNTTLWCKPDVVISNLNSEVNGNTCMFGEKKKSPINYLNVRIYFQWFFHTSSRRSWDCFFCQKLNFLKMCFE